MPVRLARRRYILFSVTTNSTPEEKKIWDELSNSIQTLYGAKGLSLIDPNLIEYNEMTKTGIVRCTHDTVKFLHASLASIVEVSGTPATFRVQRSSGTLKTLRRKAGIEKPKKEAH